jgi:hypothetical protein
VIRWLWAFIDRPLDRFDAAAEFWCAVTDTTLSPRRGEHGEFATFLPRDADACLKLQGVHSGGGAHLDIDVDDVDAATHAAVEEHGASLAWRDGTDLSVLRTPAGQLFCLTRWDDGGRRRPAVVETGPDGPRRARSRVDQICLDIGPEHFEREAEFWGAFTGWGHRTGKNHRTGESAEFARVQVPDELPVRILLQRRATSGPPSAHLDVACGGEVPQIRAYHESLGASRVAVGEHWQVMRDPAGGLYCLTERDPETGRLPT